MNRRQGQRSVADSSTDFRTRANQSRWNPAAQIDAIMHKLSDYIKDKVVSHKVPSSLDDIVDLSVRIAATPGNEPSPAIYSTSEGTLQPAQVIDHTRTGTHAAGHTSYLSQPCRSEALPKFQPLLVVWRRGTFCSCLVKRQSSSVDEEIQVSSATVSPQSHQPLLQAFLLL